MAFMHKRTIERRYLLLIALCANPDVLLCCHRWWQELLDKLGVDPAILSKPKKCPSLSVVPRRSTVEAPAVILPECDKR